MEDVKFTEWAALVADLFTFLGGMILAIDAVMAVRHFQEEEHRLKTSSLL